MRQLAAHGMSRFSLLPLERARQKARGTVMHLLVPLLRVLEGQLLLVQALLVHSLRPLQLAAVAAAMALLDPELASGMSVASAASPA